MNLLFKYLDGVSDRAIWPDDPRRLMIALYVFDNPLVKGVALFYLMLLHLHIDNVKHI